MKKLKIGIILLSCLLLVGCGSATIKEKVDPINVQKILEDNSYQVYDTTEQIGYAKRGLYAYKSEIIINYVQATKKYDVQGVFLDECTNVYNVMGDGAEQKSEGGKNWTYLIVTNEDKYYFVGWVDDSYITITAPIDFQKKLNKLVEELGYK